MTSLQGITVAIALSGIKYFNSIVLGPALVNKLANMTPLVEVIHTGEITYQEYIPPHGSGKGAYPGQAWIGTNDAAITLSSGQLHSFSPQIQSISQGEDGQFVLTIVAQSFSASFTWNEQYNWIAQGFWSHPYNTTFQNYTIGFGSLTIIMTVAFKYANDSWALDLVSVSTTPTDVNPNIPSNSVLQYSQGTCGSTVTDASKSAVDNINFSGAIMEAVSQKFASIPATGRITADISFQFEEGPDGLTFPGSAGILAGVTGVALYKGTAYAGENPPTLPMPSMPTEKHLAYNVSDYTFNSLMWAFYSGDSLNRHVVPGDLPDPGVLNTNAYSNTPLQALYKAYPGVDMTADIVAKSAPTVAFEQIYDLTDAGYAKLQSQLPADVYGKLKSVVNQSFLTESGFSAALANALGKDPADLYKTIIEQAALILAGVVTHDNQVVLNVVQGGAQIPVITFEVVQTDVLQKFALGVSGAAQTLGFAFQIIPELTQATFISSPISGIDGGDFGFIWNMVLQPEYARVLAAIGQAGVALPRIPNFDFVFSEAVITLNSGYVNVVTDVQHTADAGRVMYLASKMLPRQRTRAVRD